MKSSKKKKTERNGKHKTIYYILAWENTNNFFTGTEYTGSVWSFCCSICSRRRTMSRYKLYFSAYSLWLMFIWKNKRINFCFSKFINFFGSNKVVNLNRVIKFNTNIVRLVLCIREKLFRHIDVITNFSGWLNMIWFGVAIFIREFIISRVEKSSSDGTHSFGMTNLFAWNLVEMRLRLSETLSVLHV